MNATHVRPEDVPGIDFAAAFLQETAANRLRKSAGPFSPDRVRPGLLFAVELLNDLLAAAQPPTTRTASLDTFPQLKHHHPMRPSSLSKGPPPMN